MTNKVINDFTIKTAVESTDIILIQEAGGTTKNAEIAALGILSGWIPSGLTFTYASADSPIFTATVPGDQTAVFTDGMRFKLTQSGAVKYFILHLRSYSSGTGLTTLYLFGGTDYTLTSATISGVYYSGQYAPAEFPLSKYKWAKVYNDNTAYTQSPNGASYYNIGSAVIAAPVGSWLPEIRILVRDTVNKACYTTRHLSESPSTLQNNIWFASTEYSGPSPISADYRTFVIPNILTYTAKTNIYLLHYASTDITAIGMSYLRIGLISAHI